MILNIDLTNCDINSVILNFHETIYDFFASNYIITGNEKSVYEEKYQTYSKNQLKKALKTLKAHEISSVQEIKYVSRLLRNRYRKKEAEENTNHERLYSENVWNYCKRIFEPNEDKIKPDFSEQSCYTYFKDILSEKKSGKNFVTPSWMKSLPPPS